MSWVDIVCWFVVIPLVMYALLHEYADMRDQIIKEEEEKLQERQLRIDELTGRDHDSQNASNDS